MHSSDIYSQYYLSQAGFGGIGNVYQGTRIQRGYGLGGFFASMFRSALPMLKQGAKAAGKALFKTGLDVATDALSGANIKQSARERFRQTGHLLANRAVDHLKSQVGSGPLVFRGKQLIPFPHSIKRKRSATKRKKKTLQRNKKHRDIFA